ncbi:hypothetical protein TFUB4_01313 [Tannerella forsythia]|uniref:hypothetical protein n=1 Tax=Tannerella forsythia TaxID=28112 RepID=UPI00086D1238|nr:hypothetical protein [Tannerella forsythia]SCQ20643.1 hypothetical protein TFUB4_01313 [Tannerella forsythia]
MLCIEEEDSITGNFAPKKEAYANRQNKGIDLPEKKQIGQIETNSNNGADNLWVNNSSIQL